MMKAHPHIILRSSDFFPQKYDCYVKSSIQEKEVINYEKRHGGESKSGGESAEKCLTRFKEIGAGS